MARAPDYQDRTDEGPRPATATGTEAPVLPPNEARGGVTHHNVRVVLAVSLGLIVLVFLLVYLAFFS